MVAYHHIHQVKPTYRFIYLLMTCNNLLYDAVLHTFIRYIFFYDRGFMLDVCRNFYPKEEIFLLIDVMSSYKLNKLHLHLSEDEGWRLQIHDLPELTEVFF